MSTVHWFIFTSIRMVTVDRVCSRLLCTQLISYEICWNEMAREIYDELNIVQCTLNKSKVEIDPAITIAWHVSCIFITLSHFKVNTSIKCTQIAKTKLSQFHFFFIYSMILYEQFLGVVFIIWKCIFASFGVIRID